MKKLLLLLALFLTSINLCSDKKLEIPNSETNTKVYKKILNNGLTVLVKPTSNLTNVAIEMWYNVGSKDEKTDEKGLAHLLEHTVFKGTKDLLSEQDIDHAVTKLSGYCNAETSYDYTRYIFQLPVRHWQESLPILADCMTNCTFKQDLLNSEFKAVIQELKLNKDYYESVLMTQLISAIFSDHPYHYPVIGFKQDVWAINSEKLYNFYKKHYIPNNAVLVIVGNVNTNEAFEQAEKHFGNISPDFSYKKQDFYFAKDIHSKSVTIYRDTKTPKVFVAFVVPGIKHLDSSCLSIISNLLCNSSTSRLYEKLFLELELVNNIDSSYWDLNDYSIFTIGFDPKELADTEKIINIINEEIKNIVNNGIKESELKKIINTKKISYYNLMDSNSSQAHIIGSTYQAIKDENAIFNYLNQSSEKIETQVRQVLSEYFRPAVMHRGFLLPLPDQEKQNWNSIQEESDKEDIHALSQRVRTSELEPCKYANKLTAKPISSYDFPKPKVFQMKNGIKVLYHDNKTSPMISLNINLKAHCDYPEEIEGIHYFLTNVLSLAGTKDKTHKEIKEELYLAGSYVSISPANIQVTTLSEGLEKTLTILYDLLTDPKFTKKEIEIIRKSKLHSLQESWENPEYIVQELINKAIYKNHPYSKNYYGTPESITQIRKRDLMNLFRKYVTPRGAVLSISGDLSNINIIELLENTLGNWDGPEIIDLEYPKVEKTEKQEINYYLNIDQTSLVYSGLSIDRTHPDFFKLKIFDQVFNEKLFELRQRTGLFYTISGSLTTYSELQPGIALIHTCVSNDKLKEAEELIEKFIDNVADSITESEIKQAKNNLISSWINYYSNNKNIIYMFRFLDYYKFPFDYFNSQRIQEIQNIEFNDIKTAVKKILNNNNLVKIRVGRVETKNESHS